MRPYLLQCMKIISYNNLITPFCPVTYAVCSLFAQDRIVSMTLDKEYDVAVQAIKLLTLVLK